RLAHEVDAEVRDDAVEPSEEAGAPLKRPEALEDTKESVLDELASVVLVADQGVSDREGAPLVTFDQRPERGGVSCLRLRDERTIFFRLPGPDLLGVGRRDASLIHRTRIR